MALNPRQHCRRCTMPIHFGVWCLECVATWAWGALVAGISAGIAEGVRLWLTK